MCPDLNGSLFHHILETELQFKTIDLESSWGRLDELKHKKGSAARNTAADAADAADVRGAESRPAGQTRTTAHAFRITVVGKQTPSNYAKEIFQN